MEIEWKYKNAFRKAVRLIERFYPDYALIGRFARNFYAPPETTLDIDFLVDLDDYERLAELIEYISSQYKITPNDVGHWQYVMIIDDIKVDLVKPPGYNITKEFLSKRRQAVIKGVGRIYITSPEDLAVLYVISSKQRGVKDVLKAKDVIKYSKARNDFNEEYFLKKCRENGVEHLCLALLSNT
ncbi:MULTISPECIES: hypothetical protein [unclassified Stygiolobus]|uniref:hypothetical protein n=1 Tax=unclassified Stygiolobus TaxID=2824672 RepID=UPI00307FB35A